MKFLNKKTYFLIAVLILAIIPFSEALADVNVKYISKEALVKAPELVKCTLESGTSAACARLVVKYQPDNLQTGPFCPSTLKDSGGIWQWDGDNPGLYKIDETFLKMINGQGYTFYDADGSVHITDVRTTRPEDKNSCLAASLDKTVEMTILLPINPVKADKPTSLGTVAKVGLALDGVPIFADAPSVLDTGHMPALDSCGGHVDPGGWYHWHATATDINTVFKNEGVKVSCQIEQKASAIFAYAFDGYPMYGHLDNNGKVPTDLDKCNGHISSTLENPDGGYHYHASNKFPNLPSCLRGVVAQDNFSTNAKQGIGAEGGPRGRGPGHAGNSGAPPPEFSIAAKSLGVSVDDLVSAIMNNGGRQLNTTAAALELGVTEIALKTALKSAFPKPKRK
jgi:hypothetical protein